MVERRGSTVVLQPVSTAPFWATATPAERAAAFLTRVAEPRPQAPVLPDDALSREQIYD